MTLVLTRQPGTSLIIAGNIKVTVVSVQGKQVRLGIDAPKDVEVWREEIYLELLQQDTP